MAAMPRRSARLRQLSADPRALSKAPRHSHASFVTIVHAAVLLGQWVAGSVLADHPRLWFRCLAELSVFLCGGVLLFAFLADSIYRLVGTPCQPLKSAESKFRIFEGLETARSMLVFGTP